MERTSLPPGKLYYTIGEVASWLGVNPSLIRFWETEFEVIKPAKTKKGNRLFTLTDTEKLRLIYHLVKERGFTLQGARDYMKKQAGNNDPRQKAMESLLRVREMLKEMQDSL